MEMGEISSESELEVIQVYNNITGLLWKWVKSAVKVN